MDSPTMPKQLELGIERQFSSAQSTERFLNEHLIPIGQRAVLWLLVEHDQSIFNADHGRRELRLSQAAAVKWLKEFYAPAKQLGEFARQTFSKGLLDWVRRGVVGVIRQAGKSSVMWFDKNKLYEWQMTLPDPDSMATFCDVSANVPETIDYGASDFVLRCKKPQPLATGRNDSQLVATGRNDSQLVATGRNDSQSLKKEEEELNYLREAETPIVAEASRLSEPEQSEAWPETVPTDLIELKESELRQRLREEFGNVQHLDLFAGAILALRAAKSRPNFNPVGYYRTIKQNPRQSLAKSGKDFLRAKRSQMASAASESTDDDWPSQIEHRHARNAWNKLPLHQKDQIAKSINARPELIADNPRLLRRAFLHTQQPKPEYARS
jgi:hypothetical protein